MLSILIQLNPGYLLGVMERDPPVSQGMGVPSGPGRGAGQGVGTSAPRREAPARLRGHLAWDGGAGHAGGHAGLRPAPLHTGGWPWASRLMLLTFDFAAGNGFWMMTVTVTMQVVVTVKTLKRSSRSRW